MSCMNPERRKLSLMEISAGFTVLTALAVALFPTLALARQQRNAPSCQQNLAQIGEATRLYFQDWDQKFYPNRFNCDGGKGTGNATSVCPDYLNNGVRTPESNNLTGGAELRYYWCYILRPYLKSYQTFVDPQNPAPFYPGGTNTVTFFAPGSTGTNYGGQNSYGFNGQWLSPVGSFGGKLGVAPVTLAAVPRPASTTLATDTQYYVAAPDTTNSSGYTTQYNTHCADGTCATETAFLNTQGAQYTRYWENLGNANWSETGGTLSAAGAVSLIKTRHAQTLNTLFVDGHVKNVPFAQIVGDICYWTTDIEGPHPACK